MPNLNRPKSPKLFEEQELLNIDQGQQDRLVEQLGLQRILNYLSSPSIVGTSQTDKASRPQPLEAEFLKDFLGEEKLDNMSQSRHKCLNPLKQEHQQVHYEEEEEEDDDDDDDEEGHEMVMTFETEFDTDTDTVECDGEKENELDLSTKSDSSLLLADEIPPLLPPRHYTCICPNVGQASHQQVTSPLPVYSGQCKAPPLTGQGYDVPFPYPSSVSQYWEKRALFIFSVVDRLVSQLEYCLNRVQSNPSQVMPSMETPIKSPTGTVPKPRRLGSSVKSFYHTKRTLRQKQLNKLPLHQQRSNIELEIDLDCEFGMEYIRKFRANNVRPSEVRNNDEIFPTQQIKQVTSEMQQHNSLPSEDSPSPTSWKNPLWIDPIQERFDNTRPCTPVHNKPMSKQIVYQLPTTQGKGSANKKQQQQQQQKQKYQHEYQQHYKQQQLEQQQQQQKLQLQYQQKYSKKHHQQLQQQQQRQQQQLQQQQQRQQQQLQLQQQRQQQQLQLQRQQQQQQLELQQQQQHRPQQRQHQCGGSYDSSTSSTYYTYSKDTYACGRNLNSSDRKMASTDSTRSSQPSTESSFRDNVSTVYMGHCNLSVSQKDKKKDQDCQTEPSVETPIESVEKSVKKEMPESDYLKIRGHSDTATATESVVGFFEHLIKQMKIEPIQPVPVPKHDVPEPGPPQPDDRPQKTYVECVDEDDSGRKLQLLLLDASLHPKPRRILKPPDIPNSMASIYVPRFELRKIAEIWEQEVLEMKQKKRSLKKYSQRDGKRNSLDQNVVKKRSQKGYSQRHNKMRSSKQSEEFTSRETSMGDLTSEYKMMSRKVKVYESFVRIPKLRLNTSEDSHLDSSTLSDETGATEWTSLCSFDGYNANVTENSFESDIIEFRRAYLPRHSKRPKWLKQCVARTPRPMSSTETSHRCERVKKLEIRPQRMLRKMPMQSRRGLIDFRSYFEIDDMSVQILQRLANLPCCKKNDCQPCARIIKYMTHFYWERCLYDSLSFHYYVNEGFFAAHLLLEEPTWRGVDLEKYDDIHIDTHVLAHLRKRNVEDEPPLPLTRQMAYYMITSYCSVLLENAIHTERPYEKRFLLRTRFGVSMVESFMRENGLNILKDDLDCLKLMQWGFHHENRVCNLTNEAITYAAERAALTNKTDFILRAPNLEAFHDFFTYHQYPRPDALAISPQMSNIRRYQLSSIECSKQYPCPIVGCGMNMCSRTLFAHFLSDHCRRLEEMWPEDLLVFIFHAHAHPPEQIFCLCVAALLPCNPTTYVPIPTRMLNHELAPCHLYFAEHTPCLLMYSQIRIQNLRKPSLSLPDRPYTVFRPQQSLYVFWLASTDDYKPGFGCYVQIFGQTRKIKTIKEHLKFIKMSKFLNVPHMMQKYEGRYIAIDYHTMVTMTDNFRDLLYISVNYMRLPSGYDS